MKRQLYCAIIGDINNSRALEDRNRVQRKFERTITAINKEFRLEIASRFQITLGDEFQGVLRSPAESYRIIRRVTQLMYPVQFTFGVGVGTISTAFKKEPIAMDGDVFHRARNALDRSKRRKRRLSYDFDHPSLEVANALVQLMEVQHGRLTPRQQEVSLLIRQHGNQTRVAKLLRVSQPAIWKAMSTSGIRELHEAEQALGQFLSSVMSPS